MRFSLLLCILYWKLKKASRKNEHFKSYISTMRARILIKTADGKRGRLFVFQKGGLSSITGGRHSGFDAAIVWSDATVGFKVMASGSDEASFQAAAQGKLRVEGMSYLAQWFTEGVKIAL